MLWEHYVFRRGPEVQETWDQMFRKKRTRLLYVTGRGFDIRGQAAMFSFVDNLRLADAHIEEAKLVFLRFPYELSPELADLTETNAQGLKTKFNVFGPSHEVTMGASVAGEDDLSDTNALRLATKEVLDHVTDQTDIVLDVSSLPRVAAIALTTGFLQRLIPNKTVSSALYSNGVNLQILVAEDAALDGQIRPEDPANDLVLVPGFAGALRTESMRDWPLVWFPILGENRGNQLDKVMAEIPADAEICPVLPHPSSDPRRADRLLIEYKRPLFDSQKTEISNILLVHERNPFEAYRQLLQAMRRYLESMGILGGCRLVVTPLGSKLITVGAGLACFEMKPVNAQENYGIAIPYAAPTRYVVSVETLRSAKPVIATLLLTGDAYQ